MSLGKEAMGSVKQDLRRLPEEVREVVREELRSFFGGGPLVPDLSPSSARDALAKGSTASWISPPDRSGCTNGHHSNGSLSQYTGMGSMDSLDGDGRQPGDPDHPEAQLEKDTRAGFAAKMRNVSMDYDSGAHRRRSNIFAMVGYEGSFWHKLSDEFHRLQGLVEPERTGVLAEVVLSKAFQGLAASIILLNCVYMVVSANAQVEDPGGEPTELESGANMFFMMFYTLEVILKLFVHRCFFFWNADWRWNALDLLLVAYGYCEIVLGGLTITWLRSLRLFRMVRVLRVLKLARSMKELRLILSCLLGSFVNLLWSIVMIAIIVFMFSLVFVQETAAHFESTEARDEELLLRFGSVEKCMLNLFEAAMGGQDWEVSYNALQPTGPISCAIYLFFIAFIQIALVNILTGIFVEKALMRAQPDRETQAIEHRNEVTKMRSELRELCRNIDMDGTGTISPREFDHPRSFKLKDYLHFMGLDMEDIQSLFDLLSGSSKDKSVDVEVFVSACLRMRNGTSAVDMQRLLCEVELNRRMLSSQLRNLAGNLEGACQSRAMRLPVLSRAPSCCVAKPDRLDALAGDQHDVVAPDQHPNLQT